MRERASAHHCHKMNPNRKPRVLSRKPHGLLERRSGNHQAGARKNAFLKSPDDRFVDFLRDSEVISIDDQTTTGGRNC